MEREELTKKLNSIRNGTYTNIAFVSNIISNKDNKDRKVQKHVNAVVRLGVAYSHIDAEEVKARQTTDEQGNEIPGKLAWGEWDPECGYLINHNGKTYLRCTVSRSPNHSRKVSYLLDGVVTKKEDVIPLTRGSEWNKKETLVFDINIENILSLGKEGK